MRNDPSPTRPDMKPCPICRDGRPLDVVYESAATWVSAPVEAPLPGYLCVVSKRHVVEPFDLPVHEMRAFWEDAMRTARALYRLVRPIKMNYEIHGNTIPHLHLHLFPRYAGDPYTGRPIDLSFASFVRSQDELDSLRAALQNA
jgi:diadenosine tetraphosphate (Ap4A) HIT family hydrolase